MASRCRARIVCHLRCFPVLECRVHRASEIASEVLYPNQPPRNRVPSLSKLTRAPGLWAWTIFYCSMIRFLTFCGHSPFGRKKYKTHRRKTQELPFLPKNCARRVRCRAPTPRWPSAKSSPRKPPSKREPTGPTGAPTGRQGEPMAGRLVGDGALDLELLRLK